MQFIYYGKILTPKSSVAEKHFEKNCKSISIKKIHSFEWIFLLKSVYKLSI